MYVTRKQLQSILSDHYQKNQSELSISEAVKKLYFRNQYVSENITLPYRHSLSVIPDSDFLSLINNTLIDIAPLMQSSIHSNHVNESDIIPDHDDIFVYANFDFFSGIYQTQEYIEVNYVYSGSCNFVFEGKTILLTSGDFLIVGPNVHRVHSNPNHLRMISISIRQSTFEKVFFALLAQRDLLSNFFNNTIFGAKPNYLLFQTHSSLEVKSIIQNLYLENNYNKDIYKNNCSLGWLNILFSTILRNYGNTIQMYNQNLSLNFLSILNYIEETYTTLTIHQLATHFNYTDTYMSHLIPKIFDLNFSELIKKLKMEKALNFLLYTDISIDEIASRIGYNSADHFSRMFKKTYNSAPTIYRQQHRQ